MYALKADTFRMFGRFNWLLVAKAIASNQAFLVLGTVLMCQYTNTPKAGRLLEVNSRYLLQESCANFPTTSSFNR